jgi:hypothetical protein
MMTEYNMLQKLHFEITGVKCTVFKYCNSDLKKLNVYVTVLYFVS